MLFSSYVQLSVLPLPSTDSGRSLRVRWSSSSGSWRDWLSSREQLHVKPTRELVTPLWAVSDARAADHVSSQAFDALRSELPTFVLCPKGVVQGLAPATKSREGLAWGEAMGLNDSPQLKALRVLEWAAAEARAGTFARTRWLALLDEGMLVHIPRLQQQLRSLADVENSTFIGHREPEGHCSGQLPVLVSISSLKAVYLPAVPPPSRGLGRAWAEHLQDLLWSHTGHEDGRRQCNDGLAPSSVQALERAFQRPSGEEGAALAADALLEVTSPLLSASAVGHLSKVDAMRLASRWSLFSAIQSVAPHVLQGVQPEWLTPLKAPAQQADGEVWLSAVDGNNLLQEPSFISTKGLPSNAFLAGVHNHLRSRYPKLPLKSIALLWCRDCITATVLASLPAPYSNVLQLQLPLPWRPDFIALQTAPTSSVSFHIAVPFACKYDTLRSMLSSTGAALASAGVVATVHVGWSACPGQEPGAESRHQVELQRDFSTRFMQVRFVPVATPMARSVNCNAAAAGAAAGAVLAVIDVDMEVTAGFFLRALALTQEGATAYFPVVWSTYSADAVSAVEEWFKRDEPLFSPYRGSWRSYGFGMFTMYKSDFDRVGGLDPAFQGWGGEDYAFYKSVKKAGMVVLRSEDRGMVHRWHPKSCEGVAPQRYASCIASWAGQEGSPLGVLLKHAEHKLKPEGSVGVH